MRKPPAIAMAILTRLGPGDEALAGDLVEDYGTGRSRRWFWRQVVWAVVFGAIRSIRQQPLRAVAAVATGWTVLIVLFALLGDPASEALAKVVWAGNWRRQMAYAGAHPWWPFQIAAALVSYAGFAIAAGTVARLHRGTPAMLLAFTISVAVALAAAAAILEIVIRRSGGVAVPHALFYAVSVTLPYQGRSGLLLGPLVVLLCGMAVRGREIPAIRIPPC